MTITSNSPITVPVNNNILQDFSDATAGRSLQLYKAVIMTTTAGETYALTRDGGLSYPSSVDVTSTGSYDFDITINKPTIFAGLGYVDIKIGATGTNHVYIIPRIYHYDGVTETLISTEPQSENVASGTTRSYKLPLTITKKLFGIGHTLRLKVYMFVSTSTDGDIYVDPQTAGNELNLWMPIINLE